METDNALIQKKIKDAVKTVDSGAEIILYGSRARGTAENDSDWDILILLNKPQITLKDEQFFRHKLFDVGLETGQSISTYVYSLAEWNTRMSVTPLHQNITREGIRL